MGLRPDLREYRVGRSAAEPGVAGPVEDGDYPFEFGDGEVGDFSAVKALGLGGLMGEYADQVLHALQPS